MIVQGEIRRLCIPCTATSDTEDNQHRARAHILRKDWQDHVDTGAAEAIGDDEGEICEGIWRGALDDQGGDARVRARVFRAKRLLDSLAHRQQSTGDEERQEWGH